MSDESRSILDYQQKCFTEYARSIGLPEPYTYPQGNPIRPLPPLQTKTGGLMIVGAYPSARFESRASPSDPRRRRLIPVADNLHPFAKEEYFDGQPRQQELMEYLARPAGSTTVDVDDGLVLGGTHQFRGELTESYLEALIARNVELFVNSSEVEGGPNAARDRAPSSHDHAAAHGPRRARRNRRVDPNRGETRRRFGISASRLRS
jgi:hypothetical protein